MSDERSSRSTQQRGNRRSSSSSRSKRASARSRQSSSRSSRMSRSEREVKPFDLSQFNGRLGVLLVVFFLAALVLVGRLVWLQIIDAESISERGTSREVEVEIQARRGTIYDRNGTVLATTVDAYNIFCHPHIVSSEDVDELAETLADVCGGDAEDYKSSIESDSNFVYLYKGADEDQLEAIQELDIDGVDYEETTKRVYPCGSTASQIIGVLNSDGEAISGLELYYDDILGGTAGSKTIQYSKEGVPVPGSETITAEVVNGQDIVLSIDVDLQEQLEEALEVRVEEVDGSGGSAIVMDAETGEIYACSSSPTFDITDMSSIEEGATNLSCISSAYEPGSTMKVATMLAALEEGVVSADSEYYCPAELVGDGYTITDSHERSDATMSVSTIIADSSNVGISLVAKDLGFEKLYEYLQAFQITDLTDVDYSGEAQGSLAACEDWSEVQGYNISFGQGLTTTPIAMVRFYAALANDGVACQPHFLLDVPTEEEERTYETIQIVDDQDAIDSVEDMMEEVVESGTATDAQIDGYRVVGKTGTAEIASESGGYQSNVYNISFIGYLPDASIKLVCFVGAYDVPGERQTVSAFQDIMSFAIDRYNITQG